MKRLLKKSYLAIPKKKLLFDAIKRVIKLPRWLYQHFLFEEPYKITIDKDAYFLIYNKSCIENDIYWNGFLCSWEKNSLKLWIEMCRNANGTIFDIGANSGIYSLVAASLPGSAPVYAFEPNPLFFEWLSKNISINGRFFNIMGCRLAVGESDEFAAIQDYSQLGSSIEVDIISLDSFVEQHSIESIDLVKVDIEGMEPQFFKGGIKAITRFRPKMLVEVLTDEIGRKIEDQLRHISYRYFHIDESNGLVQEVTSLCGDVSGRNYLLKPSELCS